MKYKKYYKEITCKCCDGTGLQKDEYGMYAQEPTDDDIISGNAPDEKEIYCQVCGGKGYVIDDIDNSTGIKLTVIEVDEF